ncbi:MAG TPA: DNA polymerase III subunit gamma/tau [Chlamydiales bacterium]|nr:DNA polymerase III subunit gamma/tau [Chlamydiales bacterium]
MKQKYQVIARKYRPQAFRDVVGQEAIVTTLKNALRFDKVAHAYLFCGSRGVGKTTLARLFAKALNCAQPTPDFEPCNQCPSCLEILSGQSLDVIEIDGASNRGIDDIRQINETVGYAPSHGKYKIYIIDEVHMLTKEAFNALLKTLEEPPERAKFFFATTESHKVLPTIISRCQRFELARISPSLIVSKLQQIAQDLNRSAEPEALHLIASFAEGSLRDAESLFDQILCFAEGPVTAAAVRQSLGLVPQELFFSLDQAFSEFRLAFAFELVEQLFQTGKDLNHFFEQLIEHYRRLTLLKTIPDPSSPYAASARLYTQAQCLTIFNTLIHTELHKSSFPRIALESILLEIIRTKNKIPLEVLVRRLAELQGEKSEIRIMKSENAPPQTMMHCSGTPERAPPPHPETKLEPAAPQLIEPPLVLQEVVPSPISLKAVPFDPFKAVAVELPVKAAAVEPPTKATVDLPVKATAIAPPTVPKNDGRSYDTLLRFAAVELEGTIKLN